LQQGVPDDVSETRHCGCYSERGYRMGDCQSVEVVLWLAYVFLTRNNVTQHGNRGRFICLRYQMWKSTGTRINARTNQAIDWGCNWNDGDILYSELETVLHGETSSAVTIYCFGPQIKQFISGLIDRTFIDITQLGCPPIADISLPGISCTFACHNKSRHVCVLRVAYSLAQRLNFYILSLQYAKCSTQPAYHWCFPDDGVASPYILLQRARDNVRLHLPEWGPQTTGEDRNFFRPCGVEWHTVVHSGDIQK